MSFRSSFQPHSSSPARAVLMTPCTEDDHPEEGHDEAEDRDEHHPAQGVWWEHVCWRHQDPHQTTKHLQSERETDKQILGFHSFSCYLCLFLVKLAECVFVVLYVDYSFV